MRFVIVMSLTCLGCGAPSAPSPAHPPVPPPVDASAGSIDERDIDAGEIPQVTFDPGPPTVAGEVARIEVKSVRTVGGVQVKFAYANHKHAVAGGDSLGMWGFELTRGSRRAELELRSEQSGFEAEIDALEALLVLRHLDYTTFEIVLVAARAPAPLGEDACIERIEAEVQRRGLSFASVSHGERDGIVTARSADWRGYCGTYTRRVWITP
jgi:hypothetical protein